MRWLAVLLLAGAIACSSQPAASGSGPIAGGSPISSSPSPSAAPNPPPPSPATGPPSGTPHAATDAVLVDLFSGADAYKIALVGADGLVAARAQAAKRTEIPDAVELPYVSTTRSRVYFLDGDRDIRYLRPDGTTGLATSVPGDRQVHAAFAVSPDDSRIAVALLDYSVNPVALSLYVEDVGGANHAVIFRSTTHFVWPVAWRSGRLVVAYLGPNTPPFKSKVYLYTNRDLTNYPYGPNPYGGINFHVIDPTTAARLAVISGGGASGLLSKAGTAVVQGHGVDWQGNYMDWNSPQDYGSFSAAGSISPDGRMIAACCPQPASSGPLVIWFPGSQTRTVNVAVTSIDWVGWLDSSHLVTGFYQASDGSPSVVDLSSNRITAVDAHGIVAAILPSDLDP